MKPTQPRRTCVAPPPIIFLSRTLPFPVILLVFSPPRFFLYYLFSVPCQTDGGVSCFGFLDEARGVVLARTSGRVDILDADTLEVAVAIRGSGSGIGTGDGAAEADANAGDQGAVTPMNTGTL